MPSAKAEGTPTVDATFPSRVFPSASSCHPPRHLEFPEPPCTADSVQGRPALSSPAFPTASPPTKGSIHEYFHEKIPSEGIKYTKRKKHKRKKDGEREERIGYLVQAAQGFWKAADLQHDASEEISTGIDTSILYSIHIAHHVRMSLKLINEKTKQGVGQLTPAFEKTAADLSLDVQDVRDHHKTGRRYMLLAQHENGGPGTLLLTGPRVSTTWRKHLQDGDVNLLLDYREQRMPNHCAKAIEFNAPASRFIIKYMLKRGWRKEMFARIPDEFVWLTRHVDLEQLLEELARESNLTQRGEHSGGLPQDHSAFMHLLEAAGEPEVTDFMRPFAGDDLVWMRSAFPTMTQAVEEPMETYLPGNTWLDSFPVPTQQDHSQDPHRLVPRVDNQIDAIASTHEQAWLQQGGDASLDTLLLEE